MSAVVPTVTAFAFRLGRSIIGILAASQVLDIASGGAPSEQLVNNIALRTGQSFSQQQISESVRRSAGEYLVVHVPTNTVVMKLSRSRVFRLLTVSRRKRCERKTIVVTDTGRKDIKGTNVEVIR